MKTLSILFAVLLACSAASAAEPFLALDRQQASVLADPARHGAPTIVALWSIDCVHCKKNLTVFSNLARANPRLRLVTVATEAIADAVSEPLDRLELPGRRYAYGADAPEALSFAIDAKWRGELPRTLFFDGLGGRIALSGVVDEAAARRALGL